MMETMRPFIGHASALREVQESFATGRMPHAWLIAGIEGIGKRALAKHIAQFVLTGGSNKLGSPDPSLPATKLVEAETHPDLLIVERPEDGKTGALKKNIPVETVLNVGGFLHKTATYGGGRVVIVNEAHTLNRFGQNAILKIVEEPPPRSFILLTVTTPGLLLPTIRSRSRILALEPLHDNELRALMDIAAPQATPENIQTAMALCGGSLGFALKILRTDILPLYKEMIALIDTLPALDVAQLHKLGEAIARKTDQESFEALTALLIERLRQTAREQAAQNGQAPVALALWEKTRATFAAAESSNLDHKVAFLNAIADLRAAMNEAS
ncbi:MAG: DNA polymerase III subunit delta' [Alphaproteobacteria bacterium]|nr:DNA polymerase III subunit delta' [Alphaproteobacteria bacterium]